MIEFAASRFGSLAEPILERLETAPDQSAVVFLESDESEEDISVRELHRSACAYAAALKGAGIKEGDIVLVALGHCKDLIYSFWGALYTGAIPSIFLYKSPMSTTASYIERLKGMAHHAGSRLIITLPDLGAELEKPTLPPRCRVLTPPEVNVEESKNSHHLSSPLSFTSGEEIAYLQYTSGTTGMQKGVKLSHRAILNFVQSGARALRVVEEDVFVNWLPLYHDFGLFAGFIFPLFCTLPTVLLSPFKWLRRPGTLLWAIHNHRGTISFLPNSGHNHTVRGAPARDLEGLDLSSLRILINGAEPVLFRSQELFLEHFSPYGLSETALVSGYGMAENTLSVTFSPVGIRSTVDWVSAKEMRVSGKAVPVPPLQKGSKANVSSGVPMEGMEVAIIHDDGSRLPERHIGEIVFRSHSLFSGYHKREDLTEGALSSGWYHSGDLGYLAEGELYVCGRKKDLIIVGGDNIHPEDLETIAGQLPEIHPDSAAAFGVMDESLGTEKIVMICGLNRPVSDAEKMDIEQRIRRRVFAEMEVTLGEVHLVPRNWVVKTQNGKIARAANREKYKKLLGDQAPGEPEP